MNLTGYSLLCFRSRGVVCFVGGHVEAVFRVQREGEDERLQSCGVDRHVLLFHGSSSYNLISILGQGLLVAPTFAPVTGTQKQETTHLLASLLDESLK